MWNSIISAAAIIVVALIELFAAKDRKNAKADKDTERENSELRRKEALLSLQLTYAGCKLSEATAVALQEGRVNGEVKGARETFTKAENKYKDFCIEHMKDDVT